jgi:Zn-finger nucleic acid-binding protein
MQCPQCGAALRLEDDKDYLVCDFCHSFHFPEPDDAGVRALGVTVSDECPVCQVPLEHAAVDGLRILYCGRCRGMLIPMPVFVALVGDLRAKAGGGSALAHRINPRDLTRRIRCPHCGQTMDTHPYGGPGNIVIDSCSACRLDWLDYGELQRIVRAPESRYDAGV